MDDRLSCIVGCDDGMNDSWTLNSEQRGRGCVIEDTWCKEPEGIKDDHKRDSTVGSGDRRKGSRKCKGEV